jgi:hypothetical protein
MLARLLAIMFERDGYPFGRPMQTHFTRYPWLQKASVEMKSRVRTGTGTARQWCTAPVLDRIRRLLGLVYRMEHAESRRMRGWSAPSPYLEAAFDTHFFCHFLCFAEALRLVRGLSSIRYFCIPQFRLVLLHRHLSHIVLICTCTCIVFSQKRCFQKLD